jgi:hypothetical protein
MQTVSKTKKKVSKPAVSGLDEAIVLLTTSMSEMSKKIAESDLKIAESDRKIAESDRKIAESDRKIAESNARTDRMIAESNIRVEKLIAETKDVVKNLSENIGNVGNRLGSLMELVVVPGVRKEINAHGHDFTRSFANRRFRGGIRGELIAEVDLLLSNGMEAMAVEVKTSLSAEDVRNHLKQLNKLRKHEKDTNLQGKKLYGAMVGVLIDKNAHKQALKNGLYVLEILEEEKKLRTDKPAQCHIW